MSVTKQSETSRGKIIEHCQLYPRLRVQDLLKFLYQSSFGCEHLVSDSKTVTKRIADEYATVDRKDKRTVEELDGDYSRVHLAYLNREMNADTLAALFVASSKKEENGLPELLKKLEIARELVGGKLLPFTRDEFDKAVSEWAANGYSAIRHSPFFRETYNPSYRVIANRFIPLLPVLAEIDKQLASGKTCVKIEITDITDKPLLKNLIKELYDGKVFISK